jgi:hypothetical protein
MMGSKKCSNIALCHKLIFEGANRWTLAEFVAMA